MKRFSKAMISMLIVVVMLAQMFPVSLLVTPASAAPSKGYYYKRVLYNEIDPGKEYLILSSRDGTSYALKPASGAASGNVQSTTSVAVTVSNDKVLTTDPNIDYKALEWEFVRSAPASSSAPELYMLQNNATGSWLWNPVYENDGHYNMGTCITPEQDDYSGATMALFNFLGGTSVTGTAGANLINGVNGTAAYQGQWLRVQSPSGGDGNFTVNFNRGSALPCATWRYMAYTFHPGLSSDGTPLNIGSKIGIFSDTSSYPGPNGSYYYGSMTIQSNWNAPTVDLYTSIGSSGYRGNVRSIRIDPQDGSDGGRHAYIDSVVLGKTVRGIQTMAAYRKEVADKRGGGLMPSVEYPYCQFSITQNGNGDGIRVRFYSPGTADSGNYTDYQNGFYYLNPGSNGYTYQTDVTSVFIFEKVYETNPEYVYVERGSNFEPGAEYILANVESGSGYAANTGSANGGVTAVTVTNGKITSGANAVHEVSAYKSSNIASGTHAGDFFWLVNVTTKNFLLSYYNEGVIFTYPYAAAFAGYHDESNGLSNLSWKPYINSDKGALRAHMIEKDCGSNGRIVSITSNNMINGSSGAVYLYKKTYHEHTWSATGTQSATCTTGGGTTYRCSGCGTTTTQQDIPALGHNYGKTVVAATCTTAGYTTYKCSRCGDSYTADNVAALGHAEQVVSGTPATCQATGLTDGKKCSRCGVTLVAQTTIPKTDHDWQLQSTEGGSCTTPSTAHYKCEYCSQTKTETGAIIGHSYGAWYIVTHATTTSVGQERRDCSRCDAFESREIPMLESPKLVGSTETTTVGGTATVTFELKGNPGIWAQNFVIYYPEALTFVKAESSDDVFPLGNVEGNENAPVDPTTNARMAAYFADAGIANPENYMAWAYYVDNGGFENTYKDGVIVKLTFKVPSSDCLKEYPVGVFGVYASSGNDIIDADGNSIEDFAYINGKILIPDGVECTHTSYTVVTDKEATCTTDGAQHKVCNTCMTEFGKEVIAATGHSYGEPVLLREPSGLSAGIMRQTCTICGNYIDTEILDKPATKDGISASVNNEEYRYYWTTRVYPGREYMILNSNEVGKAMAMGNGNSPDSDEYAITANEVTIFEDGYILNNDPSLVWNSASGFMFSNEATGNWLTASLVNAEYTNLNVYTTDNPYEDSENKLFSHRYESVDSDTEYSKSFSLLSADSGLYVGYADEVAKAPVAAPSNYYLQAGDNLFFKGTSNGSRFYTDASWDFEFDISFREEESYVNIYRDLDTETNMLDLSYDFALKITPTTVTLGGVADPRNNGESSEKITLATYNIPQDGDHVHSYDYEHWHHYRILCENATLTIYIDGQNIITVNQYDIQPEFGFYFDIGTTKTGASDDGAVGFDNLFVRAQHGYAGSWNSGWTGISYDTETLYVSENFDVDANEDGKLEGGYHAEWDGYNSMVREKVSGEIGGVDDGEIVAINTFIASRDNRNHVYFFEKKLVSEMSMIYQLADNLEGGESYVLVKANKAGESTILNASTGNTEGITVLEDGVSISPDADTYLPYIDLYAIGTSKFYDNSGESASFKHELGSNYEFFATETEGGFLLNYVPANIQENVNNEGTFLKTNGTLTSTLSTANVIKVVDGKVTIGGEEYYLYKKVCVDLIDTSYVNDVAVVDFGFGFTLDEGFFRDNDTWADRVDVTLTGVAASLNALENTWFYPAGTKVSGAKTTATLTEGTATVSNGTLAYANNGKYETILPVKYETIVDHLGAYMYGTMYIIPATSVYYEDTANFISYNNSTYVPEGGTAAAWTTVGTQDAVNYVLSDLYGNSATHSSYLQYSGGSAHKVVVDAAHADPAYSDGWMPSASFTFTGTGFDVISAVGRTTCVIFVEIDDANGNDVDNIIVDNYFGYEYQAGEGEEAGKWVATTGSTDVQLYQVPVIYWESGSTLPATYTVKISVAYDRFFDHAGVGYSEFYLDGIRVYNPVDITKAGNEVALNKYMEDDELIISEENLRRLLITDGQLTGTNDAGVMFIDGNGLTNTTDAYATYNEVGAANEITLPAGKGIAFTITCAQQPEKVTLGAKVATGTTGSILVSSGTKSATVNVTTATDMYYDITDGVTWTRSGSEYTATVVITNNSVTNASLTKIKLSTGSEQVVTAEYSVNAKTENIAYRTLATLYGVNGEEFVVGDVSNTQTVNSADTLALKKYLAGSTDLDNRDYAAADIDGDGEVNAKDAMLLKKLMVN